MTLLRITPALATHRGMRRKQNEDAVGYEYPTSLEHLQAYGVLFVVADGVGGLAAGDRASQLAVEQLKHHYYSSPANLALEERLVSAVQQTNSDVHNRLDKQGATTLVAVVIRNKEMVAATVGDSLIFLIRQQALEQLNEVDILENAQTEQERSILTKAVGYQDQVDVQTISGVLEAGDRLLLCSDGLTRFVTSETLQRLAYYRDPRDGVRRMINEANKAGGGDNISAILVQIDEALPSADMLAHLDNTSAYVAIADNPLVTPAVPTKPNTVMPQAPAEAVADVDVSDEIVTSPVPTAAPDMQATNATTRIATPSKQVAQRRLTTPLVLLGIVVLALGAFLLGGALFAEDAEQMTATSAPLVTQIPENPSASTSAFALSVGTVIELGAAVVTRVNIRDSEDAGGAFVTDVASQYLIQDIFEDDEGQLWYRLQDETNGQSGWLPGSDLPVYDVISSP